MYETFFTDNEMFVDVVRQVEAIRLALSPETRTSIDEVGVMLAGDNDDDAAPIPAVYWNAAAGAFAHLYALLTPLGIDVLGSSQLMGSPLLPDVMGGLEPQFPSVSILNYSTGEGTARYAVLKLLIDELSSSDFLVDTSTAVEGSADATVFAQGWVKGSSAAQERRVLLVNMRNSAQPTTVVGAKGARYTLVDQVAGGGRPSTGVMGSDDVVLPPFAVALYRMPTAPLHEEQPQPPSLPVTE